MAEVIHAQAALDSASVSNSTSFTTRLTLAAATLSAAGFVANDEVIVFVWGCYNQSNVATSQSWRLNYNGAAIGPTTPPVIFSANFADNGRVQGWMTRVNLGGTVADFELQNLRGGTSANVTIEKARIVVLKAADLGTENTDWFWSKSTTNVAHTTTYSGTSRASITWTPGVATEDWLILCSDLINIDSVSVNCEGQVLLDGATLVAGDYSEEGEDLSEIWTHLFAGIMENLSAASHTITYQSRDDTATAANDHLESAILLVRAGKFPDLKWDTPADNATAATTPEIVANVTASLSEAQDALIIASLRIDIGTVDSSNHMWCEDNGTPIEPNLDPGAGPDFSVANTTSFDATDESQNTWLGISARSSGAQDLELWCQSGVAANAEEIVLVLWGLELGSVAAPTSLPHPEPMSPTMRHLVRTR